MSVILDPHFIDPFPFDAADRLWFSLELRVDGRLTGTGPPWSRPRQDRPRRVGIAHAAARRPDRSLPLVTEVVPGALRLPEPLREASSRALDWATAAEAVGRLWTFDHPPPTPGQLAGATALQAALAERLTAWFRDRPELAAVVPLMDTLDAAMASNPALPWFSEAVGRPEAPEGAALAPVGPEQSLFDALTAPFRAGDTLADQLAWVATSWPLPPAVAQAALVARDVLAEETTFRGFGGPGPTPMPELGDLPGDPGYSLEAPWMAGAVLQVKHGPVWLAQLSVWTGEPITRLDQIPEAALVAIREHGATCLWLVGIWERSKASRTIKQLRGARSAAASAYSLVDYVVSEDLGGERALAVLRARAARLGLRLCADVVPNHTGLDSTWVVEHPDWFIQAATPPFPNYTFDGPDISGDPRVEIRIEDGYWRGDDAAVVFEWRHVATGQIRYIYHGNDGTTMPWNDTAQLDVTLPEVREALIATSVGLARRFGILRFDAAMALAKQHVKRLWYPDPGEGGAVPSRAGHGLSPEVWQRRMPREFWSELVEAVREAAPETMLLAEAFWLMEVEFARTFGVHRVYWSAFRDWVQDGAHGEHQHWLRDVLSREPELLARNCLFLSNPDEASCVMAFGRGDRYVAAATLQATLPGLPLLAHGQVEGLAEQYGMEFLRPLSGAEPDEAMVARHQRELAPLLARRALFGRVEGFRLFRVQDGGGWYHDPVYAYTQRVGGLRALILVNASPEQRVGTLHRATPTLTDRGLEAPTLPEALGIAVTQDRWVAMRDQRTGLWNLKSAAQLHERGMVVALAPWQTAVYLDLVELTDHEGAWSALAARLAGSGVRDLRRALVEEPAPSARRAGVLLHPTSLPGREPVGTLGKPAHRFVRWLARAGQRCWQVLPLCKTGPGDSPYSSPASRLGNPLLIDLATLHEAGWLTRDELAAGRAGGGGERVNFEAVRATKLPLLDVAAARLVAATDHADHRAWVAWRSAHPHVDRDVLFGVLEAVEEGRAWWDWAPDHARPDAAGLEDLLTKHRDAVARGAVLAWWFDQQWAALRDHAESHGIELIGDLPIYVAGHSADVWARPDLFELDEAGRALRVSAVPPDAFAADGQIWGNPLYRWDRMAAEGFAWWTERFRLARAWTPVLRVDHFRGFSAYYAVAAGSPDAKDGRWLPGPGLPLFQAVDAALGASPTIAEDLGQIDEAVHTLREATGMLCTRVLQFGVADPEENLHQPDQIPEDAAVYTGTHDNDTTIGWWKSLTDDDRARVAERLGCEPKKRRVLRAMIEAGLGSKARLAITPMQDLLALGPEARMNLPGTGMGNWSWRMALLPGDPLADAMLERVLRSGRVAWPHAALDRALDVSDRPGDAGTQDGEDPSGEEE